jgi:CubicO group peptidase (beta-lactamase class C family)
VEAWGHPAAAGLRTASSERTAGPAGRVFSWASVTKVLTAVAVWVAIEEGTVAWEDPVGPPGSTLAHLLAHASGLSPDGSSVLSAPGRRRIYSNGGFDLAAAHVAGAAGMSFPTYLREAVLEPLGMVATVLAGSPASGARGPLGDLLRLGGELMRPRLVSEVTLARATSVAFPGLAGVLPGFGHQENNDWGLGVEIRDSKAPHWTGTANSPRTFGHFGQAGGFVWVDPEAGTALACLSDRPFGEWAKEAWPQLSDAVLAATRRRRPPP